MKSGIFDEHQLPRPWDGGSEQRLLDGAPDPVDLGDRLDADTGGGGVAVPLRDPVKR